MVPASDDREYRRDLSIRTDIIMASKLEDEYAEFKKASKDITGSVLLSIDMNAPASLKRVVTDIITHPGTPYFFLGAGTEAASICIGYLFVGVSYPTIDAVTGIGIGLILLWYSRKRGS